MTNRALSIALVLCLYSLTAFADFRQDIQADWLLQEKYAFKADKQNMTTQIDAAGACDGVIDGKYGFHTNVENKPWWQIDLAAPCNLDRIRVFNRTGPVSSRASNILVELSDDSITWRTVYTHDGTAFLGFTDNKPLVVDLKNHKARYIRLQLPGRGYFHLDEVEVFAAGSPDKNIAPGKDANQSSISQWSTGSQAFEEYLDKRIDEIILNCSRLGGNLNDRQMRTGSVLEDYTNARRLQRKLALADPLLDFDTILFTKRVPGTFNHMCDQYFGWWSRPGGGIFLLKDFKTDNPQTVCLTDKTFTDPGSFLRPMINDEATKVLFAWCKHYPNLAKEQNKLDKANVPEDAFYHIYEMNIDGSGVTKLTKGKYDNFDARYLPNGRIVFLSTRRGHSLQAGYKSAAKTMQTLRFRRPMPKSVEKRRKVLHRPQLTTSGPLTQIDANRRTSTQTVVVPGP